MWKPHPRFSHPLFLLIFCVYVATSHAIATDDVVEGEIVEANMPIEAYDIFVADKAVEMEIVLADGKVIKKQLSAQSLLLIEKRARIFDEKGRFLYVANIPGHKECQTNLCRVAWKEGNFTQVKENELSQYYEKLQATVESVGRLNDCATGNCQTTAPVAPSDKTPESVVPPAMPGRKPTVPSSSGEVRMMNPSVPDVEAPAAPQVANPSGMALQIEDIKAGWPASYRRRLKSKVAQWIEDHIGPCKDIYNFYTQQPIVEKAAASFNLDPSFLACLVTKESKWERSAVSPKRQWFGYCQFDGDTVSTLQTLLGNKNPNYEGLRRMWREYRGLTPGASIDLSEITFSKMKAPENPVLSLGICALNLRLCMNGLGHGNDYAKTVDGLRRNNQNPRYTPQLNLQFVAAICHNRGPGKVAKSVSASRFKTDPEWIYKVPNQIARDYLSFVRSCMHGESHPGQRKGGCVRPDGSRAKPSGVATRQPQRGNRKTDLKNSKKSSQSKKDVKNDTKKAVKKASKKDPKKVQKRGKKK